MDKHIDPIYGDIMVLINKETYEPYSYAKSAFKKSNVYYDYLIVKKIDLIIGCILHKLAQNY